MFTTARRHGLPLASPVAKHDKEKQKQQQDNKRKDKPPALSAPPTPSNGHHAGSSAYAARPATMAASFETFSRASGRGALAHGSPRPLTAGATHLPSSVPQKFPTPAPSPSPSPLSVQAPLRLAMPRTSASVCATPSPLSSGLPSPTLPPLPSQHMPTQSHYHAQSPPTSQSQPISVAYPSVSVSSHVRSPIINIGSASPLSHHSRKLSKDGSDYRVARPVHAHVRQLSMSSSSGSGSGSGSSPYKTPNSPSDPSSPASRGSGSASCEDVLSPGDRVGSGLTLQGEVLRVVSSENDVARKDKEVPAAELEVVRRLGAGSYAVVYLVREVLSRPPPGILDGLDGDSSSADNRVDEFDLWDTPVDLDLDSMDLDGLELDGMHRKKRKSIGADAMEQGHENVYYGKEYAVKVLSKAGMDEEALEAQLVEASIHQSLPTHSNIVTLHRALETPSFLLLVLEFVPGEDLYYFLEQARDHYEPEPPSSGVASSDSEGVGKGHKANSSVMSVNTIGTMNTTRTPPTPSLLSTLNEKQLLGRRRLRLIASMFAQMCEAVAVCHDVGVYHRDIKPENFIVTDGWEDDGERRVVVVKLTDFGLSTRDAASSDMDCGSAPYMSYECRNNCAPTYSPRAADVWSLGIVLINMLYHINPWTDTTQGVCPSFSAFLAAPEHFFMQRFAGMVPTVASLLCQRVFCILPSDDPSDTAGRRMSARELGQWARELPRWMAREEPVGVPLALAAPAVSSLAFPESSKDADKESEVHSVASPISPSSTLLAQSLAAVLAQQEAATAQGSSSPAWRHRRGLSNASVGYALSSVPQSRRPASRQQSFSAERTSHPTLSGISSLGGGLGSAAGSKAATPLLRGRALGSAGPRNRVPSSGELPALSTGVVELPTVFDEGEGDLSGGSLGLELGLGRQKESEEDRQNEQETYQNVEQILDQEHEYGQEHKHDQEQEHDGEDENLSELSRSASVGRRRKRGARRGKGQIIQQQQMEIARLQQEQTDLARQVQEMREQLKIQQALPVSQPQTHSQSSSQNQTQGHILAKMQVLLSLNSSTHHSHVPQTPTITTDTLDSLASASEALARELSRTKNARSPSTTSPSSLSHSHSFSHLRPASASIRSFSSTSTGTKESSKSTGRAKTSQASPAAVMAFAGASGPTPGAMFPVSFASPARTSSAGSAARRSQHSGSTGSGKASSVNETQAATPAPAIAKKTSKWKLSFGKGSNSTQSRPPLPQIQQAQPEKIDLSVNVDDRNRGEGENLDGADAQQSDSGSAQHGASSNLSPTASRVKDLLTSLDADVSTGTGARQATSPLAGSSVSTNESWSRGRKPQQTWNSSTLGIDRRSNVDLDRNVSPNSTRAGRPASGLSSSASSTSHSSASNNWRHSTLTTSSASSGWTRYSNGSVRSVSTVATSVSGASGAGSWRNGNGSSASLASGERKPGQYHGGPPSIASRSSDKSGAMPPPNVKIMTGVPWALDELPRQLHPNPSGDIFGMPPRKQRVRKPKDLPTINERPGQSNVGGPSPTSPSYTNFTSSKAKSPLSQRTDASRSSTSLHRNSLGSEGERGERGEEGEERADGTPRKVQKGQINALAKMLSALRR